MQRQIILTADGSHTVSIPDMNVTYHSVHGAIQESMHVFIDAGLRFMVKKQLPTASLNILEIGLGTGLNVLLTLQETEKNKQMIHYTALELYPLDQHQYSVLNYCNELKRPDLQKTFLSIHNCEWEKSIYISPHFLVHKTNQSLTGYSTDSKFHLIYFDAFAPAAQPELWTVEVFKKLHDLLLANGVLVTYCSKGDVRRAMQAAGFTVEKIPGPPGKREMLRAIRPKFN
ncbi:MAG: tRNA (5-methylaminomethyl-2-thiouridine)(34)-methyltransferase MnmD [Bacteroidetes bacterium]|nr:tRNA (5-methylaminomethyl-2-thiouridine)(34)-methyltransferase MnmD [Bacteroidota bacterium]